MKKPVNKFARKQQYFEVLTVRMFRAGKSAEQIRAAINTMKNYSIPEIEHIVFKTAMFRGKDSK